MKNTLDSVSASVVVEGALGAYLLTLPFGPALPALIRQLLLLIMLVALVAAYTIERPTSRPTPPARLLPLLALVALSHLLSILLSSNPSLSLSASVYAPFAVLIFLATQQAMTTPEAWHRLGIVFVVIVAVLSLDGTYQTISGVSLLTGQPVFAERIRGSIPHPNDISLLVLLAPFVLAAVALRRGRILVVIGVLCLPLASISLIGSRSRNAWLGIGVAVAVWVAVTVNVVAAVALSIINESVATLAK